MTVTYPKASSGVCHSFCPQPNTENYICLKRLMARNKILEHIKHTTKLLAMKIMALGCYGVMIMKTEVSDG